MYITFHVCPSVHRLVYCRCITFVLNLISAKYVHATQSKSLFLIGLYIHIFLLLLLFYFYEVLITSLQILYNLNSLAPPSLPQSSIDAVFMMDVLLRICTWLQVQLH
jgi:hypothetical protein